MFRHVYHSIYFTTMASVLLCGVSLSADVAAPEGHPLHITLLDRFDHAIEENGARISIPAIITNGEHGRVDGHVQYVPGRFGQGLLCTAKDRSDQVVYPAFGNVNPTSGTIACWVKLDFDPDHAGFNRDIVRVEYDRDNAFGLYYNHVDKGFIFWMKDADDPNEFQHGAPYSVFLPTGPLPWHEGEWHHLAVTWSPDVQRIYIDGRSYRHSSYRGGLTLAKESMDGELLVGGAGGFVIDELALWDQPYAPRRLGERVNTHREKTTADAMVAGNMNTNRVILRAKGIELATDHATHMPILIRTGPKNTSWLNAPGNLRVIPAQDGLQPQIRWSSDDRFITCEVTLTNFGDHDATVDLEWRLHVLGSNDWAFMAADECPFRIDTGRPYYDYDKRVTYGRDARLPLVTVYRPSRDAGFTVFSSSDTFELVDYDVGFDGPPNVLTIRHRGLHIPAGASISRTWTWAGHPADWRSGLQAYVTRYPGILTPPRGPLASGSPGMMIGGPSDKAFLDTMRSLGVGWRMVSLYLGEGSGFGNFIPDHLEDYQAAVTSLQQQVTAMVQDGIKPMIYIQARECKNTVRALDAFSDSVKHHPDGTPIIDKHGPFGASMTCRPGTRWFTHLLDQAHREMRVFPNAAGFFFDNAWETEYADIMRAIADYAHSIGKSLASNGANARSVAWSDAIMAESYFSALGNLQYLGLVKPVVYIPIYGSGAPSTARERVHVAPGHLKNLARDMRECLAAGAFYAFNYRGVKYWSPEAVALFRKYLRLQNELIGRRWVLDAHALQLPPGCRGNIFESPEGDWIVTIADERIDPLDENTWRDLPQPVRVRAPDSAWRASSVWRRDLKTTERTAISVRQQGSNLEIPIDEFPGMAVVRIIWKRLDEQTASKATNIKTGKRTTPEMGTKDQVGAK